MSVKLPEVSENALKILGKRYLWRKEDGSQENPADMFDRVAHVAASIERTPEERQLAFEKFQDLMFNLRFVPNTPTLINAGRDRGQLAACFVLPLHDSMEGIMDSLKAQALVQKSGGGTGFSFGSIRENGALIQSTMMKAVGPIPVIKLMNYMMSEFIIQGGARHGANMAVLPIDHPDVVNFIKFKEEDGSCRSFNVSVGITDEFMQAVINGSHWNLVSRVDGSVVQTVQATELFDLICEYAHKTGDPGVLFLDTANKHNPTPHIGRLEATNPCLSYETLISTDVGLLPIGEIVRNKAARYVLAANGEFEKITNYIDSGLKKTFLIKTNKGYSVRATDNHRWPTDNGIKETKDLVVGDEIVLQPAVPYTYIEEDFSKGVLVGWLIGDGYLSHLASKSRMAGIVMGNNDNEYISYISDLVERFVGTKPSKCVREQYNTTQLLSASIWNWAVKLNGIIPHKAADKEVPDMINSGSMSLKAGFLRGLFSADGHVVFSESKGNYGIRLSSKSESLIDGAQILLAQFGIYCTKYDRSRPYRHGVFHHTDKDGNLKHYDSDGVLYELSITGSCIRDFAKHISFTQTYKIDTLLKICDKNLTTSKNTDKIVSIMEDGEDETFCLTIEPSHRMCANGIVTSNCGEQTLLPNEACVLGHLNLSKYYIENPPSNGTWGSHFNWELFAEDIKWGVRFLDNIIDVNYYPLEDVRKMHQDTNRKIGLGIMGLADLLIKLGVSYASSEAIEIVYRIADFYRQTADLSSMELGLQRGSFGAFIGSEVAKSFEFMRNACRTTVAPTGTTAIIANCSTGIEPIFALMLKREQAGMTMYEIHPLFEQYLNSLDLATRQAVVDYYFEHNSIQGCLHVQPEMQALFVQANDIKPLDHVKMQAAWQEHVDNAISKTVNMSSSATVQDVKDVYMSAWKSGCKGCTIYRDGSRAGQALSAAKSEKSTTVVIADVVNLQVVHNQTPALCKECGSHLEISGGCETCKNCGFSACAI